MALLVQWLLYAIALMVVSRIVPGFHVSGLWPALIASLVIGLFSALLSVILGMTIGMVAGFFGGAIDETLMRITEAFQILPKLLVAVVVVSLIVTSAC